MEIQKFRTLSQQPNMKKNGSCIIPYYETKYEKSYEELLKENRLLKIKCSNLKSELTSSNKLIKSITQEYYLIKGKYRKLKKKLKH